MWESRVLWVSGPRFLDWLWEEIAELLLWGIGVLELASVEVELAHGQARNPRHCDFTCQPTLIRFRSYEVGTVTTSSRPAVFFLLVDR